MLREDAKIICEIIFFPSNKFSWGTLSPKLSNKVRGVIGNRMNPFLITQMCGGGDFYMFWNVFLSFFCNYAEIACKKLSFSKQQGQRSGAWKNFEITLQLNFFLKHFLKSIAIRKIKRGHHTMRESIFIATNVSSCSFLDSGTLEKCNSASWYKIMF